MHRIKQRDVIHRWEGNPIISIEDLPFKASDIWNPGAIKIDGTYILLLTIEGLSGHRDFHLAKSADGYRFQVDQAPFMVHAEHGAGEDETIDLRYEEISIMDARITRLDDTYYIVYVAESRHGYRLGLAQTDDFKSVKRLGYISEVDVKAGALFPEKVDGHYVRLERPNEGGRIWISYSEDLIHWGRSEVLISPRVGFWDSNRVGDAVPPIRLADGRWLMLYYGIRETSAGPLFRIGAVYLDPEDPSRVIGRTNIPVLSPREEYERIGDINNLIFSCGAILEGDKLLLYYGAAKSCICVGTTTIAEIDKDCYESEGEF